MENFGKKLNWEEPYITVAEHLWQASDLQLISYCAFTAQDFNVTSALRSRLNSFAVDFEITHGQLLYRLRS